MGSRRPSFGVPGSHPDIPLGATEQPLRRRGRHCGDCRLGQGLRGGTGHHARCRVQGDRVERLVASTIAIVMAITMAIMGGNQGKGGLRAACSRSPREAPVRGASAQDDNRGGASTGV
eukprot:scaffold98617_cov25-Phaeocystis_antarctica.AAC.2